MWTLEETNLLLLNIQKYGKNWSKMNINGRTVSSIRNRWSRINPGKQKISKKCQKCQKCGLVRRGHICNLV